MSDTRWRVFPASKQPPTHLEMLAIIFKARQPQIETPENQPNSNDVLAILRSDLEAAGWAIEGGKKAVEKLLRPVLFGETGHAHKTFEVDAFHPETGTVLEVEAGRAVVNYQFLKDLFEACMIQDCRWLAIAVQNAYKPKSANSASDDYSKVTAFMETLYASGRLKLPLEGIMIIGY